MTLGDAMTDARMYANRIDERVYIFQRKQVFKVSRNATMMGWKLYSIVLPTKEEADLLSR